MKAERFSIIGIWPFVCLLISGFCYPLYAQEDTEQGLEKEYQWPTEEADDPIFDDSLVGNLFPAEPAEESSDSDVKQYDDLVNYRATHNLTGEIYLMNGFYSDERWISNDLVGLEYFGTLAGQTGDFFSWDLQLRLRFNSRFLKEGDPEQYGNFTQWDDYNKVMEFHNFYVRFKLFYGYLFVTLGHYDIPYGLEPSVDTHSTLLQKLVEYDLGMNKDWGITLHGQADFFDYWYSVSIGSGMSIYFKDKNFLTSFRIATPASETVFGLSMVYGNLLPVMHTMLMAPVSIPTLRFIADAFVLFYDWKMEAEVALGMNKVLMQDHTSTEHVLALGKDWKPAAGANFAVSYIPNWADNVLSLTVVPRLFSKNLSEVYENLTVSLDVNLKWDIWNYLKAELQYFQEIYTPNDSREWNINLLIYFSGGII